MINYFKIFNDYSARLDKPYASCSYHHALRYMCNVYIKHTKTRRINACSFFIYNKDLAVANELTQCQSDADIVIVITKYSKANFSIDFNLLLFVFFTIYPKLLTPPIIHNLQFSTSNIYAILIHYLRQNGVFQQEEYLDKSLIHFVNFIKLYFSKKDVNEPIIRKLLPQAETSSCKHTLLNLLQSKQPALAQEVLLTSHEIWLSRYLRLPAHKLKSILMERADLFFEDASYDHVELLMQFPSQILVSFIPNLLSRLLQH